MAWNDQRDRIGAASATNRARRSRELACHLAISARFADGNSRQRVPDAATKRGAFGRERNGEAELRIRKIALELAARALRDRVGGCLRALARREVFDAGDGTRSR